MSRPLVDDDESSYFRTDQPEQLAKAKRVYEQYGWQVWGQGPCGTMLVACLACDWVMMSPVVKAATTLGQRNGWCRGQASKHRQEHHSSDPVS